MICKLQFSTGIFCKNFRKKYWFFISNQKNQILYLYISRSFKYHQMFTYGLSYSNRITAPCIILEATRPIRSKLYACKVRAYRRSNEYKFQSLIWPERGSKPRSTALEASTLTITTHFLIISFTFLLLILIFHFWDLHFQIYLPVMIINCYINTYCNSPVWVWGTTNSPTAP